MKHLTKLTVGLITIALVGSSKSGINWLKTSQTYAARPPGIPLNSIALNPFAINRLAEQITVEIIVPATATGGGRFSRRGSGVIVGKDGSTYYVLTALHTFRNNNDYRVAIRSTKPGEDVEVQNIEIIERYPDEDLVVVSFASLKDYKVAELGEASELSSNSQVYVAGWPINENGGGFQFTPARVTNRRRGDNLTYEPVEPEEGVYRGMSGGPVLNEDGQLVGIHRGAVAGDGEGALISTFLGMAPPEVERLVVKASPVVPPSPPPPVPTPVVPPSRPSPVLPPVASPLPRRNTISYATNISEVRTFRGHSNSVKSVAISPDGRTFVSGSWDDRIKVWDLATGSLKATLTRHSNSVWSVAISPDGQTVVSGSYDKTIKVWDLATGSLKTTLTGHSDRITSVAISPDGETIVSGSWDGIKVWDLATGNLKATLTGQYPVWSVAISPDGQTVVSGSFDNSIKVWDLATHNLKATLTGHSDWVASIAISPDGRTVVSGSDDNSIKVWDLATGSLKATLTGHSNWVASVAICPDGQTVVSGSGDNSIKVWDLATGSLKATLTGHSHKVHSVTITPDGGTAVSGDIRGNLKVWSAR